MSKIIRLDFKKRNLKYLPETDLLSELDYRFDRLVDVIDEQQDRISKLENHLLTLIKALKNK